MALAKGGARAVVHGETMSAADDEPPGRLRAAARETRIAKIICTFTFQRGAKARFRTMMGAGSSRDKAVD